MERHPRLVVTGGGGQLGRAFQALLAGGGGMAATFVDQDDVDLTAGDAVRRTVAALEPEVIVHAGAYTAVDAAEGDKDRAWAVNVDGTRQVAKAATELGALLVYVSTDYVFDGTAVTPYPEGAPTHPLSVYGATKLAGEEQAAAAPNHLIVRTSWVFGDGKNFVRAILRAASAQPGRELTVVDDQRGRVTYAPDLAEGLLGLIGAGGRGLFHLQGGGEPGSWADVAEVALEAAGLPSAVRRTTTAAYDEGRPGPIAPRPAYSVLDCSKAAALGVALRPWRDAVAEYVKVAAI
ncbi:MAG TPA: dTDP-4-dehydrorhamnose reductase [Acidimicrobiia bacterium]|nr:dTDP-4-dehydrorhamnose reductase [Acidimicrobiia bacterium]